MAGNGPGKIFWILLIGFILLSWFQYKYPEKTNKFVDPVYGSVDGFMKENLHMGGSSTATTPAMQADTAEANCPNTEDKVCGSDGKTYKNICYATYSHILQVTPGECTN